MRKILLLTAMAVFLFSGVFAQNGFYPGKKRNVGKVSNKEHFAPQTKSVSVFSEDFEGGVLPSGWSKVDGDCGWLFGTDGSSAYWTVPAHSTYAYVNDDDCNGDMSDVWLITPSIDFSSVTGAILSFESACYNDIFTVKASVDGGVTWTDVQTIAENGTVWTTEQVSLAAYNGMSDVKIAFHYNDNADWGYGWAIDDVEIYIPENDDLSAILATPDFAIAGANLFPTVTIKNLGQNTATDFSIQVVINDGSSDVYTSTKVITGASIASMAQEVYTMDDEWTGIIEGEYTITATAILTGDADATNDVFTNTFSAYAGIEGFAATTSVSGIYYLGTPQFFTTNSLGVAVYGGCKVGNNFYAIDNNTSSLGYFNETMDTWTVVGPHNVADQSFVISMAYDAVNDKLYTLGLSGTYPDFAIALIELDYTTGAGTIVATSPQTGTLLAIAASNSGELYGVMHSETGNGTFYSINPTTAALTSIGDMGSVVSSYFQSMTFDASTGICYFQAYDDEGGMNGTYSIDLTTGAPTLFGVPAVSQITAVSINTEAIGPLAIAKTPVPNAVDVAIDATVSVTFDVNISETDFTGIVISPDPGNVAASIVDNVLTIAHDNFAYNTMFTVTVPAGSVNDGTDNLMNNVVWSFTTMLDPMACNDPSDIIVSDITITGATVAWTENGAGTEWTVLYGPAGFDPETEGTQVNVTVNPTTILSDLTANTEYEVYVQAICGAEVSGWAGPVTFTTLYDCSTVVGLDEGFETQVAPVCWDNYQAGAGTKVWAQETTVFNNGAACAAAYYESSAGTNEQWLVTHEVNVPASYRLSFYVRDHYTTDYLSTLTVKVSTDGGSTYTDLLTLAETDVTNAEFTAFNIDLTAYEGQNVKFAFVMTDDDGDNWYLDDVLLSFYNGIENNSDNSISIYPNPSNGFVNIAVTENSVVSVVDVAGRTVATYNVNANEEVNFTQSAGMYIVKVESNGKVSTHKLVIE